MIVGFRESFLDICICRDGFLDFKDFLQLHGCWFLSILDLESKKNLSSLLSYFNFAAVDIITFLSAKACDGKFLRDEVYILSKPEPVISFESKLNDLNV